MSDKVTITLPPSPTDEIFKNRGNRRDPAQSIWGQGEYGSVTYIPERLEHIEGEGNFVHYYGCPYPSKTIAPVEAIYACNPVKRRFINYLRLLSSREMIVPLISLVFIGKKRRGRLLNKVLSQFNEEADLTLTPYYLKEGFYCKIVKEIRKFIESFLISLGAEEQIAKKTAEIIGVMFEYDNAYRYRVHDILNEAIKEALLANFPKEMKRLLILEAQRETSSAQITNTQGVHNKFLAGAKLLKYAWIIPSLRKHLRKAVNELNFDNLKLDQADIYHTLLYGDYNTEGKTPEERFQIYIGIHGTDQSKWPPRIKVSTK